MHELAANIIINLRKNAVIIEINWDSIPPDKSGSKLGFYKRKATSIPLIRFFQYSSVVKHKILQFGNQRESRESTFLFRR